VSMIWVGSGMFEGVVLCGTVCGGSSGAGCDCGVSAGTGREVVLLSSFNEGVAEIDLPNTLEVVHDLSFDVADIVLVGSLLEGPTSMSCANSGGGNLLSNILLTDSDYFSNTHIKTAD
jgi:hypothetical protein